MTGEGPSPFDLFLPSIEAALTRLKVLDGTGRSPFTSFVGVSGGADSVFLLHILSRIPSFQGRLTVLHFNHGTRGTESDEDALFVERLSRALSIPFLCGRNPGTPREAARSEVSLRKARFAFFDACLSKSPDSLLFLAHNKDDQVETILMNLFRGTGPRGLLGIPERRDERIVRPLLPIPGETIRRTLSEAVIPFRQDSSNQEDRYLRNRVRKSLVPLVRTLFPPLGDHHLADMAELLKREFSRSTGPDWTGRIADFIAPEELVFPLSRYRKLVPSLQSLFLRTLLEFPAGAGIPLPEERNLLRSLACDPVHEGPMGKGWHLRIEFPEVHLVYKGGRMHTSPDFWEEPIDDLLIQRLKEDPESASILLPTGGILRLWWERHADRWTEWERGILPSRQCLIDPARGNGIHPGTLSVTMIRSGTDRVERSGGTGTLTLSRLVRKKGLPRSFRDRLPGIRWGSGILWVPYALPIRVNDSACPALPDEGLAVLFEERRDVPWKKSSGNP